MYLTFAWRYFKAKKSANAINIIAWVTTGVIAFATCCQILVLSVFNGFEDLVKSLYSSFYADIRIIPAKGKTIYLDAEQIAGIRKMPDVEAVSLVAEEKALLKYDQGQLVVTLKGVDSAYSGVTGVSQKTAEGVFETGDAENPELVVGSGIRYAAGLTLDPALGKQVITIILPRNNTLSKDPMELLSEGQATVSGMFSIQQEFDDNFVFTNLAFMREQLHFPENSFSAAEVRLTDPARAEDSRKNLQAKLGNAYRVQTRYEQNNSLYNTMRLEKWVIYAILTLILLIAAFNMISALTMLVLEKKQDIQILKSMGAEPADIKKIFLAEGLLLGMLGTAAGILLAVFICLMQIKFQWIKLTGGAFLIDFFPVKVMPIDFLLVAFTAWMITWMASWLPAAKAAREPILIR